MFEYLLSHKLFGHENWPTDVVMDTIFNKYIYLYEIFN